MFEIVVFFTVIAFFFYGYSVGYGDKTLDQYIDSAILAVLSTLGVYAAIGLVLKLMESL